MAAISGTWTSVALWPGAEWKVRAMPGLPGHRHDHAPGPAGLRTGALGDAQHRGGRRCEGRVVRNGKGNRRGGRCRPRAPRRGGQSGLFELRHGEDRGDQVECGQVGLGRGPGALRDADPRAAVRSVAATISAPGSGACPFRPPQMARARFIQSAPGCARAGAERPRRSEGVVISIVQPQSLARPTASLTSSTCRAGEPGARSGRPVRLASALSARPSERELPSLTGSRTACSVPSPRSGRSPGVRPERIGDDQ